MPVLGKIRGSQVEAWIWTPIEEVESSALDQIRNVASLPIVYHHVAVMPDVHFGKGCTVGSVVATLNAITPAITGVDIGCGMGALRLPMKASHLPDNLKEVRRIIEATVPVGFNSRDSVNAVAMKDPLWDRFPNLEDRVLRKGLTAPSLTGRARVQCGTLGGGNHFIELSIDQNDDVWLVLHSGSRNIGKELAEFHIHIARELEHNRHLPDKDLAYFIKGTPEFAFYRKDLMWAQDFAMLNRKTMMRLVHTVLEKFFERELPIQEQVLCHHNYVAEEIHYGNEVLVTRKGAIRAGLGEMGIIPGSMGTKSYIVSGLGNPESFESASHGAGRRMSRGAAKRMFTREDLIEQTKGVECRTDSGVIDEIPGAYKDIEKVMVNQSDLVKIKYELKQVLCIKG